MTNPAGITAAGANQKMQFGQIRNRESCSDTERKEKKRMKTMKMPKNIKN